MKNFTLFFLLASAAIGAAVHFTPGTPASVNGRILSDSGTVWVAKVELLDTAGIVLLSTITDENGVYRFDSLSEGRYLLRVSHPSFQPYTSEVFAVGAEENHSTDLALSARPVTIGKTETEDVVIGDKGIREEKEVGEAPPTRSAPKKNRSDGFAFTAPVLTEDREVERPSEGGEVPTTSAGTLTAGEINDYSKWTLWEDLTETAFNSYKKVWGFNLKNRYPVQVTYENGLPVVDAEVQLISDRNEVVFLARTDNTGKAELWADMVPEVSNKSVRNYKAIVKKDGQGHTFTKLDAYPNGLNKLEIKGTCATSDILDVAFVVDATGSMGDEINYLKTELQDVINRVKEQNKGINLRTASVFYRDHTDAYLTRESDFTENTATTTGFIARQYAAGGGDFPEAVDDALDAALNKLSWSTGARGRLLFLVLDAPPHQADSVVKRMHQLVYKAAAMGVRIIPVTASGINKDVEFLMRSMALATNGTYTFLTDHSGVGNKHLEPSTDSYDVEKLNDLLVRLINRYAHSTGCEPVAPNQGIDSSLLVVKPIEVPRDSASTGKDTLTLHCFPVPTQGPIDFEVNKADGMLFLFDNNGKLVERYDMQERKRVHTDMGQLAAGIYHVRYEWKGRWVSNKIVLYH